jgi:hypothetical protein
MGTPTKAKPTKNTQCLRGDGATPTEVFNLIGEVTSFSAPTVTTEEIEVTNFDSTAKEFISSGLADGGEISLEMNFVGSDLQQQGLRTDAYSGVTRNFRFIMNDHATTKTTVTFAAFVKMVDGPKGGVGEAYKTSVTLKVTGQPTWSYAP